MRCAFQAGGDLVAGDDPRMGRTQRRTLAIVAALAAGLLFAAAVLCIGGQMVYGAVQRETRSAWSVTFDYLQGIRARDAGDVDRETCDGGDQAREVARKSWKELDKRLSQVEGRDEFTATSLDVLPDDPEPAGKNRVRVPASIKMRISNVPDGTGGDVTYVARHTWTLTLEKRRFSWCVLRVDRPRPLA